MFRRLTDAAPASCHPIGQSVQIGSTVARLDPAGRAIDGEVVSALKQQLEDSQAEAAAASDRHGTEVADLKKQLADSQAEAAAASDRHGTEVAALKKQLADSQNGEDAVKQQLADACRRHDAKVAVLKKQLADSQAEAASASDRHGTEVTDLKKQLADSQAAAAGDDEVGGIKQQLADASARHADELADLKKQLADSQAASDRHGEEAADLKKQLAYAISRRPSTLVERLPIISLILLAVCILFANVSALSDRCEFADLTADPQPEFRYEYDVMDGRGTTIVTFEESAIYCTSFPMLFALPVSLWPYVTTASTTARFQNSDWDSKEPE